MNGNQYFMFTPVESLTQFEEGGKLIREAYEQIPDQDQKKMMSLASAYEETHISYFIQLNGALSYIPDTPEADINNLPYRQVTYQYVFRGKETAFIDLIKQWRALYEKKEVPYRVDFFQPVVGMDGTLNIIMQSAKDAEHLAQMNKHISELLGGDEEELSIETQRLIREQEVLTGRMRPDLDYSNNGN